MKILNVMVFRYVRNVLTAYLDDHGLPATDLSAYDLYIERVRLSAQRHGHFELLKLGIARLLSDKLDLAHWIGWRIYEDEDAREPIEYMYQKLWPDAWPIPPGGPPEVELVPCPWEVWNVTMPGTIP